MRILIAHNEYQEPGGEDQVFAAEVAMLRRHGHEVITWTETNHNIGHESEAAAAMRAIWSRASHAHIVDLIRTHRPDIAHFHNTFYRMSPSVFHACHQTGTPVVLTLHNYRLMCPSATLYRDGHVCEACTGRLGYWPGIRHGCWQNSHVRTALVASIVSAHQWLGTWRDQVDTYIALTDFARRKYVEWGLPPEQVVVKPNFANLSDLPAPVSSGAPGAYALFAGRMVAEKGIWTLLEAWRELQDIPLRVIGEGPLFEELKQTVARERLDQIELWGRVPRADLIDQMRNARFLVFPSQWYEGFPMTIVEAFACGLPVIVSDIGSISEIVQDGVTGLHAAPSSAHDLAAKVRWAWDAPTAMQEMGRRAYQTYHEQYSERANYDKLIAIYERALHKQASRT